MTTKRPFEMFVLDALAEADAELRTAVRGIVVMINNGSSNFPDMFVQMANNDSPPTLTVFRRTLVNAHGDDERAMAEALREQVAMELSDRPGAKIIPIDASRTEPAAQQLREAS